MNVNFKTHFPWPGADGKPEETRFAEKIVAGLTRRHGDTELAPKLHTIRRVKTKPRFRAGMKLVLTTGGRFTPTPFCEKECVSTQLLRLQLEEPDTVPIVWRGPPFYDKEKTCKHWALPLVIQMDEKPVMRDAVLTMAQNDGLSIEDFTRWFTLDLLTNGPGTYELVHWTDLRY